MKILSIDIGVHNMALYIEEFDENILTTLSLPKNKRYDLNGCATPEWRHITDTVYKNGKKVFHDKVDLSHEKGTKFNISIFINLSNYLQDNAKHFDDCDFIIIEQQLKTNPMAQRLEQHCISWFSFMYLDTKEIIIFPASNKTRVLGAPKKITNNRGVYKKMSGAQRKKWACEETTHILNLRNDMATLHFIFVTNKTKKDDLSDVIVQLNAFKIKYFIDKQTR